MPLSQAENDARHMRHAVRLAARHLGNTAENPSVGCIIVKDGRVVGRGVTARSGRPHAETQAIAQAGKAASGSTAYVTLEPCAHTGQTGPCAEALVAAGIHRVVIGMIDPDPRVAGAGVQILEKAGIEVAVGCLESVVQAQLSGFCRKVAGGRPIVSLKLATSLDGKIALANGQSQWITGQEARRHGHMLRASNDAIITAAGTVIADDPDLTCRIKGLGDRSPVRIILDRRLESPLDRRVFQSAGQNPTLLFYNRNAGTDRGDHLEALRALGVDLCPVESVQGQDMALDSVLKVLSERGVQSVLIEGGARLAQVALKQDLVDKLYHYQSPKILGSDGLSAVGTLGYVDIPRSQFSKIGPTRRCGPDQVTLYERQE